MAEEFYDALETRDPEQRDRDHAAALGPHIAFAKANSPYYAEILADFDAAAINSRQDLAALPVTRKGDLAARQQQARPLGGLNAVPPGKLRHIFMSPGPIYEPDGHENDYWRFGRVLWAAGFRPGDIVHNSYSYHLTPAAMLAESGAHAIGCPVFPAGVGNSELQAQAMAEIGCQAYCGTPSFLRILLSKADEMGLDVSAMSKASVGGEALLPAVRQELANRGVSVFNSYGTADVGTVAYESSALEGMIVEEGVVLEIVEPLGSKPVADGEVGEVVITTFNQTYPMIRFATGDLSAILPGTSPCGRSNRRIKGWMGRADQSTKVKGMFVHPSNVAAVAAKYPEIRQARLVVRSLDNVDVMTLHCVVDAAPEGLAEAIQASIQTILKLRGEVAFVDSLPADGKVIEDTRDYQ